MDKQPEHDDKLDIPEETPLSKLITEYIKANEERRYDDSHKIFLKIKELDKNLK